jgi:MFS family permease
VLTVSIIGGLGLVLGSTISGVLSDRIGRRSMLMRACSAAAVWAIVLFPILETGSLVAFTGGVLVTMFISGLAVGPLGAFLSELFHTRYRYTAAGLSYSLGAAVGGALPPLLGAAITAAFGAFVFGLFLAALALLSVACVFALAETKDYDLDSVTEAADERSMPAEGAVEAS